MDRRRRTRSLERQPGDAGAPDHRRPRPRRGDAGRGARNPGAQGRRPGRVLIAGLARTLLLAARFSAPAGTFRLATAFRVIDCPGGTPMNTRAKLVVLASAGLALVGMSSLS